MAKRDSYSNFKFLEAVGPANMLASGDITGQTIDTRGYETVTFMVHTGRLSAITSVSYIQLIMQHTDASALGAGPSDFAIVSATDIIGISATSLTSGIFKKLFTSGATALSTLGSTIYPVGYRGTKRYVRLYIDLVDSVGAASDAISAMCMLGLPADWPVNGEVAISTSP